jgi:hypothetical protein
MTRISDALELLTAQHEQIEDLYEQVRQIGDEAAFFELADKLATHLALEQELLYPALAPRIGPDVMSELLAEHASIKQVLADLIWLGTRDADFRPKLERLGDLLFGHSAWQEDELFTAAAESMSTEELATMCARFYSFDSIEPRDAIAA